MIEKGKAGYEVSTRSRPKAAGAATKFRVRYYKFQHAAARRRLGLIRFGMGSSSMFQHAAARRRLVLKKCWATSKSAFQHAAARRRLVAQPKKSDADYKVSTRSRPKAAGCRRICAGTMNLFQHAAARRRLGLSQ